MAQRPTTAQLTSAIASGDAEAFAVFYERWFDRVVLEVRRFTGRDESFAMDVTQDVMLTVIHKLRRIETEAELFAWLRRVAVRRAISRLRSERRRTRRELESRRRPEDEQRPSAEFDEARRWLRKALRESDDVSAGLIEARFRFGWTLARIGERAGLTASAVDGRIGRAVVRLRERSEQEGVSDA